MRSAIVTETVRPLEPVSADPFIVGLPSTVRATPSPARAAGSATSDPAAGDRVVRRR